MHSVLKTLESIAQPYISSSASSSGVTGKLSITVHRAASLPDKQTFGKQDPYVVLESANQRFRTRTHDDGGKRPEWNETFQFNLSGTESKIKLNIYDSEVLMDRPISTTELYITDLVNLPPGQHTFDLRDKDNASKRGGQIVLSFNFYNPNMQQRQMNAPINSQYPQQQQQSYMQAPQQAAPQVHIHNHYASPQPNMTSPQPQMSSPQPNYNQYSSQQPMYGAATQQQPNYPPMQYAPNMQTQFTSPQPQSQYAPSQQAPNYYPPQQQAQNSYSCPPNAYPPQQNAPNYAPQNSRPYYQ